jgi:hypothetical protein
MTPLHRLPSDAASCTRSTDTSGAPLRKPKTWQLLICRGGLLTPWGQPFGANVVKSGKIASRPCWRQVGSNPAELYSVQTALIPCLRLGASSLVWSDVGCHCRGTVLLGGVLNVGQSGSCLACTLVRQIAPVRRGRKTRPRNREACYYGPLSCEDVYAVGRIANR